MPGPSRRCLQPSSSSFSTPGPLNAAIVNSVSAPVRATAISINLFSIHCFGDTFSPQIIGAISDRSNLSIGLGATLIFLVVSCVILLDGRALCAAAGRTARSNRLYRVDACQRWAFKLILDWSISRVALPLLPRLRRACS